MLFTGLQTDLLRLVLYRIFSLYEFTIAFSLLSNEVMTAVKYFIYTERMFIIFLESLTECPIPCTKMLFFSRMVVNEGYFTLKKENNRHVPTNIRLYISVSTTYLLNSRSKIYDFNLKLKYQYFTHMTATTHVAPREIASYKKGSFCSVF